MADKDRKKKRYEPPVVKEIGGVLDQAMGISKCAFGGVVGHTCTNGGFDWGCLFGNTDGNVCGVGAGNDISCRGGPWVGRL